MKLDKEVPSQPKEHEEENARREGIEAARKHILKAHKTTANIDQVVQLYWESSIYVQRHQDM